MKRSNSVIHGHTKKIKVELECKNLSVEVRPHLKVEIESTTTSEELAPNIFQKVELSDYVDGPQHWGQIYNEVVSMRSKFFAPVDSQGCERMPNTINPGVQTRNPRVYRFQLLISLMLSSQTKDEVNYEAMKKLHQGLLKLNPDGLCIESLLKLSIPEIDAYINKVGFHNRKSQYIKKTCDILLSQHGGDVPKTISELVALPGLGPKMGYLFLQNGWGINDGIGVDVHLHRLAQMWGWVSRQANTPEKARIELEKWLPKEYWGQVNPLLVGFGQVVCVPRAPNCDVCTLGRQGLCKSANKKLLKEGTLNDDRKKKLMKQRADLTTLINEII